MVIRHAKFDKTRLLLLHPSTIEALDSYRRARRHHQPSASTAAFLVSSVGTRLQYSNVLRAFHQLLDQAGLPRRRHGNRPRMHDLRHRFTVRSVVDGYAAGVDVGPRLAALSTYLGHTRPAHTYWYVSGTPELLGLAAARFEASQQVRP